LRHSIATAAAAVLLCTLTTTACSSNSGSGAGGDGKPSPTKTANPRTAYLTTAHQIRFNGQPADSELTTYPPQWCDGLKAGHSVAWLFSTGGGGLYPIGQDWGTVKKDAYTLLVAGVRAYCPAQLDTVTSELRETGEY